MEMRKTLKIRRKQRCSRFQFGTLNVKCKIILRCKFGISKAKHMTNAPFLKERGGRKQGNWWKFSTGLCLNNQTGFIKWGFSVFKVQKLHLIRFVWCSKLEHRRQKTRQTPQQECIAIPFWAYIIRCVVVNSEKSGNFVGDRTKKWYGYDKRKGIEEVHHAGVPGWGDNNEWNRDVWFSFLKTLNIFLYLLKGAGIFVIL